MDAKHFEAQVLRFARITALALAGQLLVLGHWPGWAGLWAMAVGAGETALREAYPTVRLPDRITSALDGTATAGPTGMAQNPPGGSPGGGGGQ